MSQSNQRSLVSGEAAILARRYADAIYNLVEGEKQLDPVAADLRALRTVADNNPEFISIANHPRLTRAQLVTAANSLTSALKLNPVTGKFLALVAQHRRLSILAPITDAFLSRLAKERGEYTATIRSASALSQQQSEKLSSRLATLTGGKVHLIVSEDKSLIGGLTVQLRSHLIDASIKSKLLRLERKLKATSA